MSGDQKAILLTGVGKRYDIVSCFQQLTKTIAVDPNPLAPAQYAADRRYSAPPIADERYVPALMEICEQEDVGLVLPLTDLDIEVLAKAREEGLLKALVPSSEVARATFDKYEAHLLLGRLGLPSPPTVLPEADLSDLHYPVMVKPRKGSGARSIHLARTMEEASFFVSYVDEPVMIQRAMNGPELSIDCLGDEDGVCLNAIPRTMLESRGGESIKGQVIADRELIELGRDVMESLKVRGPATIQVFRDPEIGIAITDVNTRFGGAFPGPTYASMARGSTAPRGSTASNGAATSSGPTASGRTYPELIVRLASGEKLEPHVGEFDSGTTFTRYYWQLELDEQMRPTGREIVDGGPPAPSCNN